MGEAPTDHLKEIKELEIVIEASPKRDEKSKHDKQRVLNNRRSAIERTRKEEKKRSG